MTEAVITHRGSVYPRDCDHMDHLNVASYVEKFDQATWNFFADLGLTRAYLSEHRMGLAAVDQRISYQSELRPGDVLTVRTTLQELEGKKIRFRHEMTNGVTGEVSAVTEFIALCIDTELRKARAFPPEIVARGAQAIAGAGT